MIVEKYGKIKPSCKFAGKRVVCRRCNSVLIFQADDECRKVTTQSYGWEINFDCPFCGDKEWGDIYKNKALEFIETHKLTHKVYHWWRVEYWNLIAFFIFWGIIGGAGFGVWWLINDEIKTKEAYRYTVYIDGYKSENTYYTNNYTINDGRIMLYEKDNPNNVVYADISRVQIVDRGERENQNGD